MQHTRTHKHICKMCLCVFVPESKKAQNKVYLSTYIDLGPQTDSSPASKLMSVSRVSRGRREGIERGKKTKMIKRGRRRTN